MHELSIAKGILDIVEDHVPAWRAGTVRRVRVAVGALSGVLTDSLTFCFEALVADTPFAPCRLVIQQIPVRLSCRTCAAVAQVALATFVCPACGSNKTRVTSGRELRVVDIELDDPVEEIRERHHHRA